MLAAAMAAAAPTAHAALVETWSGAGPHACHGRCSMEWAIAQLTPDERAQLEVAMREQSEPGIVAVEDGDVFSLMSYFKDDAPVAYRTTTVAMLESAEYADGWEMNGWSFVKMRACDNWSIIQQGQNIPVLPRERVGSRNDVFATRPPSYDPPIWFYDPPSYDPPTWEPPFWEPPVWEPPVPEPPAPVPVPAGLVLMLTSLWALSWLRRI